MDDNHGQSRSFSGLGYEYYRNYRAAYVQDDWKVNPKLTVNLGYGTTIFGLQQQAGRFGKFCHRIARSNCGGAGIADIRNRRGPLSLPAPVANSDPLSAGFISDAGKRALTIKYTNANPQPWFPFSIIILHRVSDFHMRSMRRQ